ncbi:glycosyltransferase family 1 protein [Flaviaesturariibacter flavus]|uniref:Glycosyltransferase family 1 protein n=1 Tax=Flaviaesturariibacter flavus TaxID=2502780 RepID=A0A4R1BPA3_9BACT|nr:glycosyltransferase [Flaviaesturariibacter flavus]TCJ19298.1 glycosyltransferase family 1 protein [Flaviaesturariibacter flavus]
MNIVLYEREHFEILGSLLQVLNTGAHRLHLLLPAWMDNYRDTLPPGAAVHHLPEEPAAHPKAVEQLCREKSAELLVLGTVSFRHWQFAAVCRSLAPGMQTLLYVHDANDLLTPQRGTGLRGWARYLGKLRLRRAVSAYVVLLDEMKAYLEKKNPTGKPVLVIPGAFYDAALATDPEPDRMVLAIPGSIDSARRNYSDVKAFADLLKKRGIENGYAIRLLGSVSGRAPGWIGSFQGLVEFDPGGLLQPEFDNRLKSSELAWLPLAETFRRDGHPSEYYGITKSSGAYFDALRFGKPVLAPDGLPVPGLLASALLRYSDATYLFYLLEALQQNPAARHRLQQLAREQAGKVRVDDVRARLRGLISHLA